MLADLPPKIITDIYCDLSELQARLYSDFQASKVGGGGNGNGGFGGGL